MNGYELREALLPPSSKYDSTQTTTTTTTTTPTDHLRTSESDTLISFNLLETNDRTIEHTIPHLDQFLTRVYNYFLGKGFYPILFSRVLNLIALLFIMFLSVFLISWVDWEKLFQVNKLSESVDFSRRVHPVLILLLLVFAIFWVWQVFQTIVEVKVNLEIRHFYRTALYIPDREMAVIQWREVVARITKVPRLCIVKEKLTPLDIANRMMRKENYFIALVNKNILNLDLPFRNHDKNQGVITRTLEWSLNYIIFNFIFTKYHDSVKSSVMSARGNPIAVNQLAASLQKRFILFGLASLVLSPFVLVFLLVYIFYKYGEEIRYRPGTVLGAREWTHYARWQFREFNEPLHIFQRRLALAYYPATSYVNNHQVPLVTVLARFISFILGSILAVLVVIGIFNEQALFQVVIVFEKTPIWFVGILGSLLAVIRALIPDENQVFDPVAALDEVISHTHYMPRSWRGKLHTQSVFDDVCQLFQFKWTVFARELFSVVSAPLILIFSLPRCANDIVQFFIDFTVDLDGVGHVCSFATFNLSAHGNVKYGAPLPTSASAPQSTLYDSTIHNPNEKNVTSPSQPTSSSSSSTRPTQLKRDRTKQGKLEKSILTFKANHPDWISPESEALVANLDSFVMGSAASDATNTPNPFLQNSNQYTQSFGNSGMFASKTQIPYTPYAPYAYSTVHQHMPSLSQSMQYSDPASALSNYHRAHQQYYQYMVKERNPEDYV
eukprot:TRINITY_DN1562_c0_g1_i4.p1 TRINITY_DN1562_c0_g1~~TRINITY_DN1562_c0_g1_i4.p1  ORF type:complete len:724 (-),score=121.59 TRINITY_DN1562_c0_g1_i4:92-2263(-)